MPHILVVDDDDRIRQLVSRYLKDNNFVVGTAHDAAHAREMLKRFQYDALVVDIMMPGETGLELTQSLRQSYNIPILLLTALGDVDDRIAGLEGGADDYLSKPFEPRELVLRLEAILRRAPQKQNRDRDFKVGQWIYDAEQNELYHDEVRQRLTDVEGNLLRALASRSNMAVNREELARLCNMDSGERTIDVQVTRLRKKLEKDPKVPRFLQTVRGKGYLLRAEEL